MTRKLISIFLTAVLALSVFGLSANAAEQKTLAVIMPNATHGFMGESMQHAEAELIAQAEKYGFDYKFVTSGESTQQNNDIDTVLASGVDCIVLFPHNGDELRAAAQNVLDAGVPLIIYDRLITDFVPTAELMGDNVRIGVMTGEYMNRYFNKELEEGQVNILEFKGDNSTVPTQRYDGFMQAAHSNFNIVQQFDTGWQRQTAQDLMENYLNTASVEEIESIKAVFTHDDEVVLGVLDAITDYSGSANLDIRLVTGVGGRRENLDLFQECPIDLVTFSFSPAMIREAVLLGVNVVNGVEVESGLHLIDSEMIDKYNEASYRTRPTYLTRYSIEPAVAE